MRQKCACGSGSSKSRVTNVSIFSQTPVRECVPQTRHLCCHISLLLAACWWWARLWRYNNWKINISGCIYWIDHINISPSISAWRFDFASWHESPTIGLVLCLLVCPHSPDLIQASSQGEIYIYCSDAVISDCWFVIITCWGRRREREGAIRNREIFNLQ